MRGEREHDKVSIEAVDHVLDIWVDPWLRTL